MGDPAGVGPETIAGVWTLPAVHDICRPLVVGHPDVLRRAVALRGVAVKVQEVASPEEALPSPALLPCLRACRDDAADVPPGRIDPRGGQAAYDTLVAAARLALDSRVAALVTAPLNKAALWQAGHHYPGHTELLAELCGVREFAMMLFLGRGRDSSVRDALGVVHVTLHMGLREVFVHLTSESIVSKIRLAADAMRLWRSWWRPRIGVCALNPHAGEEGLFGDEERRVIAPAVEQARAEGLDVTGPLPADTLMVAARDGRFDAVVAMYHDQGHIAVKLLGMHRAVNVTLGLPIVRTSVAHGTAFDLAWQGRAETTGLLEAIPAAVLFAQAKRQPQV
jgi:4-hydroxythreonine-4-phosphate dehydrogenase